MSAAGTTTRSTRTFRLRLIAVAIMVVIASAAVLLLTACGDSETGTTTTSEEPKVMVYAVPWTMYTSLDPGKEYWNNVYHHEVYETLADNDPTSPELVKPRLAESWEVSEDGKEWTFKLRKGVKFHGGDDFTSADVIFSFDRNRELAAGAYNFLYDGIDSWEAIDDYTVVIRTSAPRPVAAISAACNNGFIYSKAAFERDGEKAFEPGTETAGSGPYTVKSVTTTEVTYERFADHWGGWDGTRAKAPDVVVMRKVEEAAVRIQQLQTGDAHIVAGVPVNTVADLKNDPNVKFASGPWWRSSYIFLNTKSQATKDVHLREALFYAFPYEQARDMAYEGMADLASGVINQSQPGDQLQNETLGVPKQDMAKAKAALAKSAYPNGGVKLLLRIDAGMEDNMKSAQLFKAALQELNIELDVRYIASDVAYKEALSDNPPQAGYMVEWSAFYPGIANYGQMWLRSDSAYNLTYYKNPEIDKLLEKALEAEATDVNKSAEYVVEATKIARDAYPYIWVAGSPHWRVGMAKNITWGGYMPTDAYTVYFSEVQMD